MIYRGYAWRPPNPCSSHVPNARERRPFPNTPEMHSKEISRQILQARHAPTSRHRRADNEQAHGPALSAALEVS